MECGAVHLTWLSSSFAFPNSNGSRISNFTTPTPKLSLLTSQFTKDSINPWNNHLSPLTPLIPSFCFSLVYTLNVFSGVPEAHASPSYPCEDVCQYYFGLNGAQGSALMNKLNTLVSGHTSLPYKQVWDALKVLDADDVDNPEASPNIVEIYSLKVVPKQLAGKPEGWNREHLWPRSYGLVDSPSLTDLHNIRPADVNVNSSRGNKYYGKCAAYSGHCMKPANKEAASDTETDKERWAPPHQVRGDIARSLMYMAVRYGFHLPTEGPHLRLSDSPNINRKEMGLLSTLLQWNQLDPPSRAEKLRNDRICKFYQHNRNPFIDHPEYANLIWKHNSAMHSLSPRAWIKYFIPENNRKAKKKGICGGKSDLQFYNSLSISEICSFSTFAGFLTLWVQNSSRRKVLGR